MNESLLISLIKLFAIVVENEEGVVSESAHRVIANFLTKEFSREQIDEYLNAAGFIFSLIETKKPKNVEELSLDERIELICEGINTEFEQHQKVWLTLQLLEFIVDTGFVSESQLNFVQSIAARFYIPEEEFVDGKRFIQIGRAHV